MQTTTQAGPETHATAWGEATPRHKLQTRSIMRCHSSDNARFLGCQMEGVLDGCFRVMGRIGYILCVFPEPTTNAPIAVHVYCPRNVQVHALSYTTSGESESGHTQPRPDVEGLGRHIKNCANNIETNLRT